MSSTQSSHMTSRPTGGGDNVKKTYAFVKYCTMDVAIEAKAKMNGQMIRSNEIKIGYGKPQPTRCLWIGGLTEQTRQKELEETLQRVLSSSSLVSKSSIDIIWVSSCRKRERCALIELDATRQAEFVRSELRGRREYAQVVLARDRVVLDFVEPRYVDSVRRRVAEKKERAANGSEQSDCDRKDEKSSSGNETKKARRVIEESSSESESEPTKTNDVKTEPVIRVSADSNNERVESTSDKKRGGDYEKILITTSLDNSQGRRRVDAVVSSTDMVLSNGSSSSTSSNSNTTPTGVPPVSREHDENVSSTAASNSRNSEPTQQVKSSETIPPSTLSSQPPPASTASTTSLSSSSSSSLPPVLVTATQSRIISLKPKDKRSEPPTTNGTTAVATSKPNDDVKASSSSPRTSLTKQSNEVNSEVKPSPAPAPAPAPAPQQQQQQQQQAATKAAPDSSVKKSPTTATNKVEPTPITPSTTTTPNSQKLTSSSASKISQEEVGVKQQQQANSSKTSSSSNSAISSNKQPDASLKSSSTSVTSAASSSEKKKSGEDLNEEGEIVDSPPSLPAAAEQKSLAVQDSRIPKRLNPGQVRSVIDLGRVLVNSQVWSGVFTLKKNVFPSRFFLLAGNEKFASNVLPTSPGGASAGGSSLPNLHINQRIRLDSSKLEDIERKLLGKQEATVPSNANSSASSIIDTYSVLLSLPASDIGGTETHMQRTMNNLISYLDQKQAAGVISLPDDTRPLANLNIFTPNSSFSKKLLSQLVPSLAATISTSTSAHANDDINPSSSSSSMSSSASSIPASSSDNNYLILVLLKNNT